MNAQLGSSIIHALGGMGLFLLGMGLMTSSLRELSGSALRRVLQRFTTSPVSGALAGAGMTAIIQSSSATTVAAVGFVGAGLMAFEQAVGVIIGANVGTTITGWMAAVLGFKLQLGTAVLPVLLVAVLVHMFGKGRRADLGMAVTGFCLIFVGITQLQSGMGGLEGYVTPERLPEDTLGGRMLLVLVGLVITLITQSSSSGVAAALAALHAGAISLPQAAAMVIGMDVGTTATAVLASVGGSAEARRTAFAHVAYNLMTSTFAFALLVPYVAFYRRFLAGTGEPELALVGFHTGYNVTAALLILPFARPFARALLRLFPAGADDFARPPDPTLLSQAEVAIAALTASIRRIAGSCLPHVAAALRGKQLDDGVTWYALWNACTVQRDYAGKIGPTDDTTRPRLLTALHALDHLERLTERAEHNEHLKTLRADATLRPLGLDLANAIEEDPGEARTRRLHDLWQRLEDDSEAYRVRVLEQATRQAYSTEHALHLLDAYRWLRRLAYNLHRIDLHTSESAAEQPAPPEPLD